MGYRLLRSNRVTLALEIDARGELVARAPVHMPLADIEAFIASKQGWITRKQEQARSRAVAQEALKWRDGARLPYLGGAITVRVGAVGKAELAGDVLTLPEGADARIAGRRWLSERADELLPPRVAYWARVMGLTLISVEWSAARRRWGSMSSEGRLRLNLALVHCPWDAIDYVIVHELAHMRFGDHSPAFHALVRRYLTDADRRRASMRAMSAYTEI